MGSLESGRILHLHEVVEGAWQLDTKAVRCLGRVGGFDPGRAVGHLELGGARCLVDTRHVPEAAMTPGALVQVIGEVDLGSPPKPENVTIRARVVRNVEGMDVDLYAKALEIRRRFEAELEEEAAAHGR